jgi:uncharacterized protein (DUF2249 family)
MLPSPLVSEGGSGMSRKIEDLDVREMLKNKGEPFQIIMDATSALGENDVLQLHATFEPTPLFKVLGKQGFKNSIRKEADDYFIIQFYREDTEIPYWHIDNRGLEPPNPMIRSLQLLESDELLLSGVQGLEIWNERVPAILIPELEERGLQYEISDEGNGTVVVKIHR